MLRSIGWLIKVCFFSLIVLILGQLIHWGNRTVSDEIKQQMAHAEQTQSYKTFKNWSKTLVQDAKEGARRKWNSFFLNSTQNEMQSFSEEDEISSSEKQKLKALIQELNY